MKNNPVEPAPQSPDLSQNAGAPHEVLLSHAQETQEMFAGPIPDPRTLASYEAIHAGFANRIMEMAEREQAHRHKRENTVLEGSIQDRQAERKAERRGQYLAFGAVTFILCLSAYMVYSGSPTAGASLGATTLVGSASIFIARQYYDNKEEKPSSHEDDE